MQSFVFRGEMDNAFDGKTAKMRAGRPESKECVGRTGVSSRAAAQGVDEEAGVIGQ
jgi:hypothetical protein